MPYLFLWNFCDRISSCLWPCHSRPARAWRHYHGRPVTCPRLCHIRQHPCYCQSVRSCSSSDSPASRLLRSLIICYSGYGIGASYVLGSEAAFYRRDNVASTCIFAIFGILVVTMDDSIKASQYSSFRGLHNTLLSVLCYASVVVLGLLMSFNVFERSPSSLQRAHSMLSKGASRSRSLSHFMPCLHPARLSLWASSRIRFASKNALGQCHSF